MRGAAIRILLTRLHDKLFHPDGAFVEPKDPGEYVKILQFHQNTNIERLFVMSIVIYTDGACSGNPGIGGWGAVILIA